VFYTNKNQHCCGSQFTGKCSNLILQPEARKTALKLRIQARIDYSKDQPGGFELLAPVFNLIYERLAV
jgi:hypothetical protein